MIRKTVLTLVLAALLLGLILFNGWNLFKIHDALKTIIVSRLQAVVGQESSVEKLTIGIGSVDLGGVRLSFKDSPYELWIQKLRVGYSLNSLLKGGLKPVRKAKEITIFKPVLTLKYTPAEHVDPNVDLSLQLTEEQEKMYRTLLRKYDFIERITISDGEVRIINTRTQENNRVADRISGWVYTGEKTKAWVRLAGHMFHAKNLNMVMYGQLNLQRGGIDYLNLEVHDYELGNELPYIMPKYFQAIQGTIDGNFTITERLAPTRGFNIAGPISLRNGKLKLSTENLFFDDINIDAEVKDWNIEIKKATQKVNGSPTVVTGRIRNLLDPEFELQLTSQHFDIQRFLNTFLPEKTYPFSGFASFQFSISDALSRPQVQGIVRADSVSFLQNTVKNVSVATTFNGYQLHFSHIAGSVNGAGLSGSGIIDFQTPEKIIDFTVDLEGDLSHQIQKWTTIHSLNRCQGIAEIKVFGSLLNPVSTGDYDLKFGAETAETQLVSGSYKYSHGRLVVNASSPDDEFRLSASVDSLFQRPYLSVDATNIEKALLLFDDPSLGYLMNHYRFNLGIEGFWDNPSVVVDGFRRNNYEKILHMEIGRADSGGDLLLGKIALFPNARQSVRGEVSLTKNKGHEWVAALDLGDWLEAKVVLNGLNGKTGGELFVSGMDLGTLFALLGIDNRSYRGEVYGKVKLFSSTPAPSYGGELWLVNGFFDGQGPFKADFAFQAKNDSFRVEKLEVENSDDLQLTADGWYDFRSQNLLLNVNGAHLQIADVIKILTQKEDVVGGEVFARVQLRGKLPRIPLYGSITVQNPRILRLQFDSAFFDFGAPGDGNGSYVSATGLHFARAKLVRDGQFVLAGSAQLPLRAQSPMHAHLVGDGNFLVLLTDLADLFEKSDSEGHLDLHLAGLYTKPDFSNSSLIFKNGYLRLSSVIKEVDNLEGDLFVEPEQYFLDIRKLHGTIQNKYVAISNTSNLGGLNHGIYEPLRIAGDDLNLGALILETDPDGIPLHIPGLMEKGEIGWYGLEGKIPGEQFFVAGPWERPKVRGRVNIHDTNLMYPFDEGAGDGNPMVMNIMNNIDWDVEAYSLKGTHYARQFPAGIYVNMELDKNSSHLGFSGVMKDSTFTIAGKVESTRGEIEYFDLNFRVQKMGAEFNQTSLYPTVYGKAWTVVRDSSNVPNDVYLELYSVDQATNQEVSKGRWDRINIKLSSEYPGYQETQEQLLATLGYSSDTMDEQAVKAVGSSTDNFIFRPLMRPIERQLERDLRLDVVRFSYSIAQNFLNSSFNNNALGSSLAFLKSSRLILGKYLTDDVYLLYTGELTAGIDYQFQDKGVGLRHIVGLEYRLNSKWLLQMEYDYNTLFESHKDDKKIFLRHSFPF